MHTMKSIIRVGIADDEDLVRDGMAALLAGQQGVVVVSTVSTAYEAVELADSGAIDVLLLDIALGGRGGLDALVYFRKNVRNPPATSAAAPPIKSHIVSSPKRPVNVSSS